jgi:hypothetical protein
MAARKIRSGQNLVALVIFFLLLIILLATKSTAKNVGIGTTYPLTKLHGSNSKLMN